MATNLKSITKLTLLSTLICTNLYSSEIGVYYKNYSLTDSDTQEVSQGIKTTGIKGNLFDTLYFDYEQPQGEEQEDLKTYQNNTTKIEEYSQKMKLGLKPLYYLSNGSLKNLYVEYTKDVYQLKYDTYSRFYTQELLFLGKKNISRRTGVEVSYGLFLHNNEKESLIYESNSYEYNEDKNVYGLMVQYDNLFIPYKGGTPVGLRKYGTGILIDDIKVQYQISGGSDYFFSCGLGFAHRSKSLNIYAKYTFELTTDTVVGKTTAGIQYSF